jgi:hypothetical protein
MLRYSKPLRSLLLVNKKNYYKVNNKIGKICIRNYTNSLAKLNDNPRDITFTNLGIYLSIYLSNSISI